MTSTARFPFPFEGLTVIQAGQTVFHEQFEVTTTAWAPPSELASRMEVSTRRRASSLTSSVVQEKLKARTASAAAMNVLVFIFVSILCLTCKNSFFHLKKKEVRAAGPPPPVTVWNIFRTYCSSGPWSGPPCWGPPWNGPWGSPWGPPCRVCWYIFSKAFWSASL